MLHMKWSKLGTWLERFQRSNLTIRNGGGCKHRTVYLSHLKNSLIFSDPVVPGIDVNLCISKEVDINTQDTLSMPLYLTTPIPECAVECIVTSSHRASRFGVNWLQLHHHRQRQSCVLFCFFNQSDPLASASSRSDKKY